MDYPHSTRAKKYYLCLMCGDGSMEMAPGLDGADAEMEEAEAEAEKSAPTIRVLRAHRPKRRRRDEKPAFKSREWVAAKKERQRKQGKAVRHESKYTARRRPHF